MANAHSITATKIDSTVAMKATQKAAAQTKPGGM